MQVGAVGPQVDGLNIDQSMLGEIQNIRKFFLASDNAGIIVTYCNPKKTLSIVIIITMIRWALWLYNVIYI